ncbi:MAG: DNA polymerase IV [Chloroflexi bacterium]|nr:DNA polymerase IV [Chloroflexota bacterium]
MVRHIIHADLDAFYAAVEQLDNPELRGKAVLVGGRPEGRGVVATASYEARRFGVHSAMPMATAARQCPEGIIVRPRFDRYREMSAQVMDIFRAITEIIQPVSLDEAYLDITDASAETSPIAIAIDIKNRVRQEVGLTISVGLGTGKCVAKIASDFQKPDGLVVVPQGQEAEFLAPLPVGTLLGVGPKSAARLNDEDIHTIGDLAAMPDSWFARRFGKRGSSIRDRARGIDDEPVQTSREAKSVSSETTFPQDLSAVEEIRPVVERLSSSVASALGRKGISGRTVTVKMRLSDFTTFTRQTTLSHATHDDDTIVATAWTLMEREMTPGRAFRLLGVGVSGFAQDTEPEADAEPSPELQQPLRL